MLSILFFPSWAKLILWKEFRTLWNNQSSKVIVAKGNLWHWANVIFYRGCLRHLSSHCNLSFSSLTWGSASSLSQDSDVEESWCKTPEPLTWLVWSQYCSLDLFLIRGSSSLYTMCSPMVVKIDRPNPAHSSTKSPEKCLMPICRVCDQTEKNRPWLHCCYSITRSLVWTLETLDQCFISALHSEGNLEYRFLVTSGIFLGAGYMEFNGKNGPWGAGRWR